LRDLPQKNPRCDAKGVDLPILISSQVPIKREWSMYVKVPILVGSLKVQEHPCAHALNGPPSRKPWNMGVTKKEGPDKLPKNTFNIHQIPASAI
jgi:hypothetical protein